MRCPRAKTPAAFRSPSSDGRFSYDTAHVRFESYIRTRGRRGRNIAKTFARPLVPRGRLTVQHAFRPTDVRRSEALSRAKVRSLGVSSARRSKTVVTRTIKARAVVGSRGFLPADVEPGEIEPRRDGDRRLHDSRNGHRRRRHRLGV